MRGSIISIMFIAFITLSVLGCSHQQRREQPAPIQNVQIAYDFSRGVHPHYVNASNGTVFTIRSDHAITLNNHALNITWTIPANTEQRFVFNAKDGFYRLNCTSGCVHNVTSVLLVMVGPEDDDFY